MAEELLPLLLVLWLLPCALQDWRSRHVSNWLTVPAFLLAWPWALHAGTLSLTGAVFIGCWVAWRAGGMGAADGKIATVLAAVAPPLLITASIVLVLFFIVMRLQNQPEGQIPALMPLYIGAVVMAFITAFAG